MTEDVASSIRLSNLVYRGFSRYTETVIYLRNNLISVRAKPLHGTSGILFDADMAEKECIIRKEIGHAVRSRHGGVLL